MGFHQKTHGAGLKRTAEDSNETQRSGAKRTAKQRKVQRARIVSIRVPVSFHPMQRLAMTRTGKHDIAVNRRVTHGFEKMRMAPSRSAMQCPINPETPMTTSELVLQTLSGHHEQSVGQLYKKLAGQPGINNSKSVSNALMRLKKDGRVTNTFDADRAIWLWRVVKEGEVAPQPECQADHPEHDLEMASDVAEANHKESLSTVQESLTVADADMVATLDALDTEREIQERREVAETPETFTDTWGATLTTHFKAANKPPMSVQQALSGFAGAPHELNAFLLGVAFAERHHGISQ